MIVQKQIEGVLYNVLCAACHQPIEENDLQQIRTEALEPFKPAKIKNYHKWCTS